MGQSLLTRLDAGDRALFARLALTGRPASRVSRSAWVAITHCGGLPASVTAAVLPLFWSCAVRDAALRALIGLMVSHLAAQLVKRSVARPRPSRTVRCAPLVREPPCFSFPSGHATAAMSVAFAYAAAFPPLAPALLAMAVAIGISRVRLGVHYPGDVLAGQMIAVATDLLILAWR